MGLDTAVFYGSTDNLPMSRREIQIAKSICYLCPVRQQCLQEAVARRDPWGVQGGLTGPERMKLWSQR